MVAAENGEIFELEGYGAVGMSGNTPVVLKKDATVPMPHGSELMMLPQRKPVVYNIATDRFESIEQNPFAPEEKIFPVAVFNSPGYVNRHFCAYDDEGIKDLLPLFSYGAVGFGKNNFRSAAIVVDTEPRQDLRLMPRKGIVKGVSQMQKKYPKNRLMRHLETCALQYGCPAGKNFFLKRYEAPLPTSTVCNANCLGCISLQKENNLCACQDRISFTPSPEEIAQVFLEHISHVKKAVVSFGQGCEGEPLTAFTAIEPAIRLIRKKTDKGTINLNTNASLPNRVEELCRAGLDSMRVSMNSVRKNCYTAYFRPRSYHFSDVLKSIDAAKQQGKFVAINYLNCPGFTDSQKEFEALNDFIDNFNIDMIQWRNLNFDPKKYCELMSTVEDGGKPLGMDHIIQQLSNRFPKLIHGYFNPPVR
ncbi:radical SAM protein [Desulfobacula toluolica]|uniref:Radical SAM domain protein n=1 Tax=Desulfobacula toluolica (strain DSM 7467 / Tol2) TaxID=651182 RepID=K0NGD7_DESTT|nr:radical SAM protein [Desulfobacula toluolica]CCK78888.1 radical SAM domain protein [Desulfobacula toluolica Tol2]